MATRPPARARPGEISDRGLKGSRMRHETVDMKDSVYVADASGIAAHLVLRRVGTEA